MGILAEVLCKPGCGGGIVAGDFNTGSSIRTDWGRITWRGTSMELRGVLAWNSGVAQGGTTIGLIT